jgi:protease II
LANGTDHPQTIEKARSVAWAADNRTLFYVTEDEAKRACRVWRRVIGKSGETLIYEETDARFSVSVSDSRSRGYIFITSHSATTSEVRFVRAAPHRSCSSRGARITSITSITVTIVFMSSPMTRGAISALRWPHCKTPMKVTGRN